MQDRGVRSEVMKVRIDCGVVGSRLRLLTLECGDSQLCVTRVRHRAPDSSTLCRRGSGRVLEVSGVWRRVYDGMVEKGGSRGVVWRRRRTTSRCACCWPPPAGPEACRETGTHTDQGTARRQAHGVRKKRVGAGGSPSPIRKSAATPLYIPPMIGRRVPYRSVERSTVVLSTPS